MNVSDMESLVERVRHWVQEGCPPAALPFDGAADPPILGEDAVQRLLDSLCSPGDDELSCEQVYLLLDEYAECCVTPHDRLTLKPLLEHHLQGCDDCRIRHEALMRVLTNEPAAGLNSTNLQ